MASPQSYLAERGILEATSAACGLEIELGANLEKIRSRLEFGVNGAAPLNWPSPEWAIFFPLSDAAGTTISYTARLQPPAVFGPERRQAKFVHTYGLPARPYVSWPTWAIAKRTDVPALVTEGPTRGLIAYQCNTCAIALAGVWNIADKRQEDEKLVLHPVLRQFGWINRKTFLAFDMDFAGKEDVVHAISRDILLLHLAGAVVKILRWAPEHRGSMISSELRRARIRPCRQKL
jgi:Domain of unknown function (DUF3854)